MPQTPDPLASSPWAMDLHPAQRHLPGLRLEVAAELGSTNHTLVERVRQAGRDGATDFCPTVLVAERQTQGRGRLGRVWQSAPGASLTFSLALPLVRADWSGLSLAVGLAVAQALDASGQRIGLKWPNDLWLRDGPGQGRKLVGILIEGLALGASRVAVIGIGVNIQPQPDPAYAAVSELDPQATAPQTLARLLPHLAATLAQFEAGGFARLASAYAQRDLLRGLLIHTTDSRCPQARALGVDDDGALRVADPSSGQVLRIVSGEVSVRPLAGSAA